MTLMVGTLLICETHEIVPFKCGDCDFHASKKQRIEKHWKDTHEVLKYYDCSQCKTCVTSINELNYHVKQSHLKNK